jgi:hypothetical protein
MMAQQQSMFGPTPQELQQMFMQQQQAQDMNQANQWGQGSLGQQISTAGYMGGTMLGRGLQGLGQAAGIIPEDPRIAEARKMMEIKKELMESNIDPSDIDTFYPEMIKKLNAAGFIDQANQAMRQYTQAQTAQGNLEARNAEIEARKVKALQSQREEALPGLKTVTQLTDVVKKNPRNARIVGEFKASVTPENPGGDYDILDKLELPDVDKDRFIPIFQTERGEAVFRDPGGLYTVQMRPDPEGKVKGLVQFKNYGNYTARQPTPVVSLDQRAETERARQGAQFEATAIAPTAKKFFENASKAESSLPRLENLEYQIQNSAMFLGSGADLQVNVANFLKTWAGIDANDPKIAGSQIVDALVGPEILAAMQQLGGQDSNEELRKITAMQPNRVMTKEALLHTAKVVKAEALRSKLKAQNYRDYVASGGDPLRFRYESGFMEGQPDPAKTYPVPVFDTNAMKSYPNRQSAEAAKKAEALRKLSDAELRELIKAKEAEK